MIPIEWLEQANKRIAPYINRTPLTYDMERKFYIKWENRQVTGSFKARGALNKVLLLEDWEREAGLVAASAGNHGLGLALAAQKTGSSVEIFISEHAIPAKIEAMRSLGAKIQSVAGGYPQAEKAGKAYAIEKKKTWVSPYNDGQVIAGQGTVAFEITQELDEIGSAWLVPVSGGGLLSGVGSFLQSKPNRPRLIGVQAKVAPFMHALYFKNSQEGIPDLSSIADGLTGEVESGSVTIPIVKQSVDDIVLVSEEEIAYAIAFAWYVYNEKIEGAGAVGLAAALSTQIQENPVIVVSGGNVQPEFHADILQRFSRESWR